MTGLQRGWAQLAGPSPQAPARFEAYSSGRGRDAAGQCTSRAVASLPLGRNSCNHGEGKALKLVW